MSKEHEHKHPSSGPADGSQDCDGSTTEPSMDEHQGGVGLGFGPLFFEKVLLAIIDAHPFGTKTPRQRLDAVMLAIFGRKSSPNPFKDDLDDKACLFMAQERHRDNCYRTLHSWKGARGNNADQPAPKVRSNTALAKLAEQKFFDETNVHAKHANVNRLREMFSGSYQRKQGKNPKVDYQRTYIFRAVEHDYVEESLEQQGLERLRDEFAKWGVPLKL